MLRRIHEKLKKQFGDTQRLPFMFDNTRKQLSPQLGRRKELFLKKTSDFFLLENVA